MTGYTFTYHTEAEPIGVFGKNPKGHKAESGQTEKKALNYSTFGSLMTERTFQAGGYRYGFNSMEKDDEIKGVGNSLDFSNRIYDSRLGRFLSIDPIAADFPFVTPYNFAENRVIDGIDLWGLQYVSANESFYQIRNGQVWVRTTNFHEVMDPITREKSIGRSVPIYQVNLTMENRVSSQQLGGRDGFTRLGNYLRGSYEISPKIISGERPDGRNNLTKAYTNAARRSGGIGRIGLGFAAIEVVQGINTTISGYNDHVESTRQRGLIREAFGDVITAVSDDKIPSQYHNISDLSSITNFVFQGEDNFGTNDELRNIAIFITKYISGNYHGEREFIKPESGLDNLKLQPIITEPILERP
jgi:RHS repeat-associated protein